MLPKAVLLWVIGLVTIVPYGTYYLFFEAQRDQYALLITLVLFWIFGYWGVVGPLLAAIKVRRVFRSIENAKSKEELLVTIRSEEAKEVAIEYIATENHIPRFLAARIYQIMLKRFSANAGIE